MKLSFSEDNAAGDALGDVTQRQVWQRWEGMVGGAMTQSESGRLLGAARPALRDLFTCECM